MVKHTSDLEDLALRCEQATGPDRELDRLIFDAVTGGVFGPDNAQFWHSTSYTSRAANKFTASLDAAMTLAGSVCGLELNRYSPNETERWCCTLATETADGEADGATPALALCAAALRAALQSSQPREEDCLPCPNDAVLDELVKHLQALGLTEQIRAITELRDEYAGLCHDYTRISERELEWLNPPTPPIEQENTEERPISDATKRMAKTLGAELVRTEHLKPVEAQPRSPVEEPGSVARVSAVAALRRAVAPLARLPIGLEIIGDSRLVLYKNGGVAITVGDVLLAREALTYSALAQSPDPRVEELRAVLRRIDDLRKLQAEDFTVAAGEVLDTALAAFGGKTE